MIVVKNHAELAALLAHEGNPPLPVEAFISSTVDGRRIRHSEKAHDLFFWHPLDKSGPIAFGDRGAPYDVNTNDGDYDLSHD